jgi:hypothetical protein
MDRMSGEVSDKSFWKVLMDSSSRSEFVAALHSQQVDQYTRQSLLSEQENIDQLPDFYTPCYYVLDDLSKEAFHIPPL